HESAHALTGGRHITDRAYSSFRLYPHLSTEEALTNAESYALFAQEIGTGTAPVLTAPTDTMTACPPDWAPLIQVAVGRAQSWNLQSSESERSTTMLAGIYDLLAGVHNAATRQNYAGLARELHEKYHSLSHGHAGLGAGIGATILGLGGLVLGAWLGSTLSHG